MNNQVISGIYCIENTINNKKYIGSSKNIAYRFKKHLSYLKNNTHVNKHLQSAINKYGIGNFKFFILEECNIENIFNREQYYIEQYDWSILYNKCKQAGTGGADTQRKEYYLLNLEGDLIQLFKSGVDLAYYLDYTKIDYAKVNTPRISKTMYRIVTPDFYLNHLDIVKSWKPYSSKIEYKKKLMNKSKYLTIDIVNDRVEHYSLKTMVPILGISYTYVSHLIRRLKKKELTNYIHKKSGTYISFL